MTKEKIVQLLNHALELEHGAFVQYLNHAEVIDGINAEPIIARLKELLATKRTIRTSSETSSEFWVACLPWA